jgi:organic hydroperoxide reductase OsmC/OhrA
MSPVRAKVFDYAVEVDAHGKASLPDGRGFTTPEGWTADHLVLAALVRCSIESLAYHARRAGSTAHASGSATGRVTKRDTDGRYAFVEITCRVDAELDPAPAAPEELLGKAERDCFVGASLTVAPRYEWHLR